MDRQAIAKAQRRATVSEALEFEQARAAALRDRLETIVAELEGPSLDESIFERLAPEDVEIVRPIVQAPEYEVFEDEWLAGEPGSPELESEPGSDSGREEQESEIRRLEAEIASSVRSQQAFERYLSALGD